MLRVTTLGRLLRSLTIRRLLIAAVALSPVVEQAVPDACDTDGRALQTVVASSDLPGDGANDPPAHSVHLCHCSHAHVQMMAKARARVAVAGQRGREVLSYALRIGRLPDAPPSRPPAAA
jgi:hypothetical protein